MGLLAGGGLIVAVIIDRSRLRLLIVARGGKCDKRCRLKGGEWWQC